MINYSDFDCPETYLDGKEFKAYCKRIEDILRQSKTPMSIADIHRKLKKGICRAWTCDVLDRIAIDEVSILPSRYVLRETFKADSTKYRDLMAVLFPKHKRLATK